MAWVPDTLHLLYRPGRTITMASNDARVGRLQRRLVEKIIRAHIDQTIALPVPHACAQPYHLGSGSYGQPVRRLPWLIGAHWSAWLPLPGCYGCAHAWGNGQAVSRSMCVPCFKFALVENHTLIDFFFYFSYAGSLLIPANGWQGYSA